MSQPKINIGIKFVSAKAGSDPKIVIENPISLTETIGEIGPTDSTMMRFLSDLYLD